MSPDDRCLTLEDVAELLGESYNLIYKLVRSAKVPVSRVAGVYGVGFVDLDLFLEKSKITSLEGGVCSSCGVARLTKHSLTECCSEYDSPICAHHDQREGINNCHKYRQTN